MPNDLWYGTSGPRDAVIALVGESWGRDEESAQRPFVGQSGQEFDRMLLEAGIQRNACFATNVISARPKDNEAWHFFAPSSNVGHLRGLNPSDLVINELTRLYSQLQAVQPKIVVACGNYALWALTECASTQSIRGENGVSVRVPGGITTWRGSMLYSTISSLSSLRVVPIIHPAAILRAWYHRAVTVHDLRTRVKQALANDWDPPRSQVYAPPSFNQATEQLTYWLRTLGDGVLRLSVDIETARGLITCIGLADGPWGSPLATALVIPFVRLLPSREFRSFYAPAEEVRLLSLLSQILTHRNLLLEGQNFLYDVQYLDHWHNIRTLPDFDTMLAHHLLFPGTPKSLDYLSSLYCRYHRYWKDDNKEWDLAEDETKHLLYNAEDVLRTFECATELRRLIGEMSQEEQWEWEKRKAALAFRMMRRGVRIDTNRRAQYGFELSAASEALRTRLRSVVPTTLSSGLVKSSKKEWLTSPKQQQTLLYDRLGLPPQRNRKTGAISVDDEALGTLKKRAPELTNLFDILLEDRSIGVFSNNFISAGLEPNGRMKCSFNVAGTETFRWSSSKNAFGRGTNLQNVPKGEE